MPHRRRLRATAALGAVAVMVLSVSSDYTVKPGDTLAKIAKKHRVSVQELADANEIPNPNLILIGQTLLIPQPKGDPVYHVVQPGETLVRIAKMYDTTVTRLAAVNGFPNPNLIYPGNRLLIGGEKPTFQPEVADHPSNYTVKRGDNLSKIASAFGTTVSAIAGANGLENANLIYIGQRLSIPTSGWLCPLPGASFINDWGFPRNGGRFHEGNDLYAEEGTPVLAPVAGIVEQVEGTRGGLQFWLEGNDGVLYIGTHLSALGKGGKVRAGDVVGYVGTTGNARGTAPHTHFEIHPEYQKPVNPYPVLSKACGG